MTATFRSASAACFAVAVLGAAVSVGAIALASVPDTPAQARAAPAATSAPGVQSVKQRKRGRCEECGVIQAIRRIDAADGQPVTYEITVRLHDGSVRTSRNATPGNWRAGDRIMLIKGGRSADRSST